MAYVAATAGQRSRFGVSLPLLFGLFVLTLALLRGTAMVTDPDTYWHIAAGRWMLAHHAVPHVDVFSYTRAGTPWVPLEWLSELVMAAVFDRSGWAGLVVMTALTFAGAMAVVLRFLLRYLAPLPALAGGLAAWTMALPHLLARPHSFGLLLMTLWLAALVAARSRDGVPSPWVALLMVLWANMHGGYVVGLLLAALLGGEAVVSAPDWRGARRAACQWALFGGLTLAAALATPNGLRGLLQPLHIMRMPFMFSAVVEWRSPDFQTIQPLEIWLLAGLMGALSVGIRLPWTRVVILLLLLHLALAHTRDAELIGVAAPFLLAEPLAAEIARLTRNRRGPAAPSLFLAALARPASPLGAAAAALIALALVAVPLARGMTRPPDPSSPSAALTAVAAHHITGPVLNDYNFGGYLIYKGIRPFIDGRVDVYGDAYLKRFVDATGGSADLIPLLDQYHVAWTLLAPTSPAATLLDHLPGWRRLYADKIAVVHIRQP